MLKAGHYLRKHHGDGSEYQEPPPSRVDWRWEIVRMLCQMRPGTARARLLQINDPTLTDAYLFRDADSAGLHIEKALHPIRDAYDIFMNRPDCRSLLEGLLLCDPETIDLGSVAKINGYDISALDAYADIFFDVRPRLDQWGWIFEMLFHSNLYETISSRESLAKAHRLAWLCGPELFVAYHAKRELTWSDKIKKAMGSRIEDMYYKQSFVQSFCQGRYGERDLKQIEFVINDIKAEAAQTAGGDPHADAVMTFLQQTPITVADPSLDRNLSLPAREPRTADYIAIATEKLEATT